MVQGPYLPNPDLCLNHRNVEREEIPGPSFHPASSFLFCLPLCLFENQKSKREVKHFFFNPLMAYQEKKSRSQRTVFIDQTNWSVCVSPLGSPTMVYYLLGVELYLKLASSLSSMIIMVIMIMF